MEISKALKNFLKKHKNNLKTEYDAHQIFILLNSMTNPGITSDDIIDYINICISSGVHFEKYISNDAALNWFEGINFLHPVTLFLNEIQTIAPSVGTGHDVLCGLGNVEHISLPKCKKLDGNNAHVLVQCPDLETITLPKCESIEDLDGDMFFKCNKLRKIMLAKNCSIDLGDESDTDKIKSIVSYIFKSI